MSLTAELQALKKKLIKGETRTVNLETAMSKQSLDDISLLNALLVNYILWSSPDLKDSYSSKKLIH